ncbi:hypothetical protein ACVME5_000343 [Bradyrhizobium liaoningense]
MMTMPEIERCLRQLRLSGVSAYFTAQATRAAGRGVA